jgi:regulator of protease activity HflC (stomatin/prohibitin superfamily)
MTFLGVALLIIGILAIVFTIVWTLLKNEDRENTRRGGEAASRAKKLTERPAASLAILIVGILVLLTATTIPAGHRGVVLLWGGQVENKIFDEGLSFRVPIAESVVRVDVRVQAHPFENISAASKEMQNVIMTGNVNWHFDPAYVNWIYQNIGASSDFVDKILDKALQDFVKEVTPQYSINVILNNRPDIRQKAVEYLTTNLGRYHIIINDIYIADIQFSPEYLAAIEKQQVAQRQIATEQNILEQKKIQAEQVKVAAEGEANASIARATGEKQSLILRAEGNRQSTILNAEGEAQAITVRATAQTEANKMLAESLQNQPDLLKWTLYNKLGDKIQVIILPSGQEFILSPEMLQPNKETPQ